MSIIVRRELIAAVLRGEKTQHRVPVKSGEYTWICGVSGVVNVDGHMLPAYSSVCAEDGHARYVRGTTYAVQEHQSKPAIWVSADGTIAPEDRVFDGGLYSLRNRRDHYVYRTHGYTPLRVRITAIRREHLVDISEADARAEGYEAECCPQCGGYGWFVGIGKEPDPRDPSIPVPVQIQEECSVCAGHGWMATPREVFRTAWDAHHRKDQQWGDAVDVWVLTFEIVR